MIAEQARALHDATIARIDQLATEFAALEALRESLAAFIDQPEQGASEVIGASDVKGTPAPALGGRVGRAPARRSAATQPPSTREADDQRGEAGYDSHAAPDPARQSSPAASPSLTEAMA